ncbi:MAG: hypothetical protein M3509_07515, partial [Chloroflexota bacterium]|nr:hypothetical protein [Chloroflexota bacterium]
GRIRQSEQMMDWLTMRRRAFFERHRDKIAAGEVELGCVTDLVDEHNAACSFVAGMKISFDAKYRQAIDAEEAAAKEDFLHFFFECWEDAHHRAGNGPLRQELPAYLSICAMLPTFLLYDVDNHEIGLQVRLVNPLTVFPVWEGDRGLAQLYRVYQSTAAAVIGDFGTSDGTVETIVKEAAQDEANPAGYDPHYTAEVVEYWDRNWGCVTFDDKEVRVWEHGRGKVPWIVTPGAFGMPHGIDTTTSAVELADGGVIDVTFTGGNGRGDLLRRQYQPFLWRRVPAHEQEEKAAGLFMTLFRRSLNPPLVHKQSIASAALGTSEIITDEAGRTQIGVDDDLSPIEGLPVAEITQPLLAILDRNRQTGMANSMLLGQMGASSSGTAIDIATQNGNRSWSPLIYGIQAHLREVGEDALEIVRDFGAVMGAANNGLLTVPRRHLNTKTGQAPAHEMTPDLIARTGVRVAVQLYNFDPATLGPVGNGLSIIRSQGLIDKRNSIQILGFTDDVEGVLQRIKDDQLDEVPEIQMADTVEYLNRMAEQAMQRGDTDSARKLATRAFFVASMMQAKLMMAPGLANQMGNPGAAEAGLPLPGTPVPPEGPDPGSIQYQGASLPAYGIQPGTEGGRNPGPDQTLSGGVPGPPVPPPAQG